jgi:phage replication-related protein YjqB (UPF0714/DUF867 family)
MAGHVDKYRSFAELSAHERLGKDYTIDLVERDSPVAIIAPHGGGIEPVTSEIARAIAAGNYSFYAFEGIKPAGSGDLHITSSRFDESRCVDLVSRCATVIAIHGLAGPDKLLEIGGLHEHLRNEICAALQDSGFSTEVVTTGHLAGLHANNICNRGRGRAGVQLEITRALRNALRASAADMDRFASAVRLAVDATTGNEHSRQ